MTPPTLNSPASPRDRRTIIEIAERAAELVHNESRFYVGDIVVAISLCHANGCPLDLDGLLAAPDQDFAHDVFEIQSKLDPLTGKLTAGFLPRYSKPLEGSSDAKD